jgi:hypothetical protein
LGGQGIEADDLSAGLENALAGSLSYSESGELDLGHSLESGVVGDGADAYNGLAFLGLGGQSWKRQWWSVLSAHKQSLQDDLVKLGVGSSREESVEFDEHVEVQIVRFGGLSDGPSVLFVADIDTHGGWLLFLVFLEKLRF